MGMLEWVVRTYPARARAWHVLIMHKNRPQEQECLLLVREAVIKKLQNTLKARIARRCSVGHHHNVRVCVLAYSMPPRFIRTVAILALESQP